MLVSQLILAAQDTISEEWVQGIRKGWKQWLDAGKKVRSFPDLVTHTKKGLEWVNRLEQDLLFNKGMFTFSVPKKEQTDIKKWKMSIMESLKAAKEVLENLISNAKYQVGIVTPGSDDYDRNEGKWYQELIDKWGTIDKWQAVAAPEMFSLDAPRADKEISGKLLRLLTTIMRTWKSNIEWGTYEREFSLGNVKVVMDDLPKKITDDPKLEEKYRHPMMFRGYVKEVKKAQQYLAQKHLNFLWYGQIHIKPKGTYGPNPRGEKFGVGGWWDPSTDRVFVEEDPSDHTSKLIVHELGHRYYYKFMSAADRAEFDSYFGQVSPVTEYGGTHTSEDFADVFAWYVLNMKLNRDQLERFKKFLGRKSQRGAMMKKGYQAVPAPYTQPESRSGDTFRVSDYIRMGLSDSTKGSAVEISQLMKTLSSFEEQNPYPTTIEDYLPKDTSMASDVEAIDMIPAPLTKVAVDYARKQLHFNNPLISDSERMKDNKWLVTVMTRQHEKAGIIIDPRSQKVVDVRN